MSEIVQSLDELASSWNWEGSVAKGTVMVGRFVGYPVTATISREEQEGRWVKWRYQLVLNYNGAGCRKVISKNHTVARPEEDVEKIIREEYGDELEEKEIESKVSDIVEVQSMQVEDGELTQDIEEAEYELRHYVEVGRWYEELWEGDKMEVE